MTQRWWFEWTPGRDQLTLVEEHGAGPDCLTEPPARPRTGQPHAWLNAVGVTVANPHSEAWRWSEHFLLLRESETDAARRKAMRQGTLFGRVTA